MNSLKLKEDDVILVASDDQKRLNWPLARVFQVISGNDEVPRTAKLKTATGKLVRPVQRLIILENSQIDPGQDLNKSNVKNGTVLRKNDKNFIT